MAGRAFSVIFLFTVGALAIAYAGLLVFIEAPNVPSLTESHLLSAAVLGVLGAVCLLIGLVVAFIGKPKPVMPTPAPTPQAKPEVVTVKRTQMDWGTPAGGAQPSNDLQSKLEEVNRKLGRLKVQLGLGEISNEGYKVMSADLEKERVQLEMALRQQPA